jgi:hypothetical protein
MHALVVQSQITNVTVGITPACPYGLAACWGGAREALGNLDGVKAVLGNPDGTNCTACLQLSTSSLPDPDQWREQFSSGVGEAYVFRGVEVTILGSVEEKQGHLLLSAPGSSQTVRLVPLRDLLQWDFRNQRARKAADDERKACKRLAAQLKACKMKTLEMRLTGPLKTTAQGPVLEVREFVLLPAAATHSE